MNTHLERIHHFKGTPYEIGFETGRKLGGRLEQIIDTYINTQAEYKDMQKLHAGALPWMHSLPQRFQDEFEGLADGSGIPLQRLVEFDYIEECDAKQCSGAIIRYQDHAWVARNNDTYVPELWGYVTIKEVAGRIPSIHFCMEDSMFTPTGVNKEKLWLHYNFLQVWDEPAPNKPHIPAYVFLTDALERCSTIRDVEDLLKETDRDGGMLLFAVDGKNDEFALFECLCSEHYRRDPTADWIVGTNHFCTRKDLTLTEADEKPLGTLSRYKRMEEYISKLAAPGNEPDLPADLITILADDAIERRGQRLVTAYSNVACPNTGEIWYTFGGYPSANKGNWQRLEWPWNDENRANDLK